MKKVIAMLISISKLKAALKIAPKNHRNVCLNGVHINFRLNAVESSDSYCAIRIIDAITYEENETPPDKNIILPYERVLLALTACAKLEQFIRLSLHDDGVRLGCVAIDEISHDFPSLDKTFTDAKAAKDEKYTTENLPAFDFKLLKKWQAAQKERKLTGTYAWKPDYLGKACDITSQTIEDMTFVIMPIYRWNEPD